MAKGRQKAIARSIVDSITSGAKKRANNPIAHILFSFSAVFRLYELVLRKMRPDDFSNLRRNCWNISDDAYVGSFLPDIGERKEDVLKAAGDMGFSGSTFYATADQKYLVKSVPRHSEHSFFRKDLLIPYLEYMAAHPNSLIVRICDSLCADGVSLGQILGLSPAHHIVMENVMYGKEEAKRRGNPDWEHWDLKPTSYFYPERDIAEGALASEETKSRLADEFHDKILLSGEQAAGFLKALEEDTKLLADHNAVDYSLFLVRMAMPQRALSENAAEKQFFSWRTGVLSADGKYMFRAAILDFFWAKHKTHAKAMTLLIDAWRFLTRTPNPMSITTTPDEYRDRFLRMCQDVVRVEESRV